MSGRPRQLHQIPPVLQVRQGRHARPGRRALAVAAAATVVALTSCGTSTPTATPGPAVTATSGAGASSTSVRPSTSAPADGDSTDSTDSTGDDSSSTSRAPSDQTTSPRQPAPTGPVKAGPITVVTLGDSLTEGMGDDDGRGGYPVRLPDLLAARGRAGSNVVNVGHSGWDSQNLIEGQDPTPSELAEARTAIAEAQGAGRPVIALVLIGSNDLWYLYEYGAETGTDAEAERADLERYRANLRTIVSDLRTRGAQVVLAINDDQTRRQIVTDDAMRAAAFPATTREEVGQMSAQAHRYADVVREVAAENGALVADFLDSPIFSTRSMMADDGAHPNAAGYDQLAKDWMAAMDPLLG